jgi:D-glycero-D-manno-heptose 1,7-bisphosphate phosphatase
LGDHRRPNQPGAALIKSIFGSPPLRGTNLKIARGFSARKNRPFFTKFGKILPVTRDGQPYAFYSIMKAALFIERDGVLNLLPEKNQPVLTLDQLQPNVEAREPLRQLKGAGFLLIATTNQPAISRGQLSRRELDRMHALLSQVFSLDDILVCPHDESDFCPCRKPRPGLLTEAAFKWHVDLDRSFVISNKWQDAEAARAAGCTSLLLDSPWIGKGHRDIVLPDFASVAKKIARLQPARGEMVALAG